MSQETIKPHALTQGSTIGIFTPSTPAYLYNPELFENGVKNLKKLGFNVKIGSLTAERASQGYRSGSPQERAQEFMDLIDDPDVDALMSTIGGNNSSSMIPFLDFEKIRNARKIFCGYSDVTSLHMSILHYAGLRTLYGPAVMTWMGEYPDGIPEMHESFLNAVGMGESYARPLKPFARWSNHFRDWGNGDWKNLPRKWNESEGWPVMSEGEAEGEIVVANLNTLLTAAGTPYFPALEGRILLIEEMAAPFSGLERNLRQLERMGVLEKIKGLLIGRPENPDSQGASFTIAELYEEVIGSRPYPVAYHVDCSHTVPMHSIGQHSRVRLAARKGQSAELTLLDTFVEATE